MPDFTLLPDQTVLLIEIAAALFVTAFLSFIYVSLTTILSLVRLKKIAGNDTDDLAEKLGYSSADIMLYAQTLGLNTWYVGGTFNRGVSKYVPNKKVIGIVAIGYGINNGVAHKSKTLEEVSSYDGTMPEWFKNGILASLLAPTALNKQDYRIVGKGNKVKIEINNGIFTGANKGLIKYHFELGAGKESFEWE